MSTPQPDKLSQAAYARHRATVTGRSCTRQYINKIVREGIIAVDDNGMIDVKAADQILHENIDIAQVRYRPPAIEDDPVVPPTAAPAAESQPAASDVGSMTEYQQTKAQQARFTMQLAEMKMLEKAGQLVQKEQVEMALTSVMRGLRDRLIAMPAQIADAMVTMQDSHQIQMFMEDKIRSVLEEVSAEAEQALGDVRKR